MPWIEFEPPTVAERVMLIKMRAREWEDVVYWIADDYTRADGRYKSVSPRVKSGLEDQAVPNASRKASLLGGCRVIGPWPLPTG